MAETKAARQLNDQVFAHQLKDSIGQIWPNATISMPQPTSVECRNICDDLVLQRFSESDSQCILSTSLMGHASGIKNASELNLR